MKVEMKELQKYGRELQFGIEKEEVNAERKKIISEIRNTTEIPGFRKGKAPEDIIEGRFGSAINEKVIRNLITSSYLKTITEQNIHPVIEPEISDVKLDESLTFKVYIEVKPDVTVKK
jgi:trigger factor